MSEKQQRVFEDQEAKRERVPLLHGLVGPSGSGKTYSALRLATGIQRVTGGDIYVIDTEARRALHYADRFKFRHIDFKAPFGPLDYLAAIEHCVKKGARVIVVDSMSHEHEGPGGVLELHGQELDRLTKGDSSKADKFNMLAWQKPKAERRRMINSILQMPISSIFCFRAKEKIKIEGGRPPKPLGFVAIAGEEFLYEMTVNCLLLPRSDGVPAWESDEIGERATMKLPEQFRGIFAERAALSEDIGSSLARWAEGGAVSRFEELVAEIARADAVALEAVVTKIEEAKKRRAVNPAECNSLRAAYAARKAEIAQSAAATRPESPKTSANQPQGTTDERRAAVAEQAGVAVEAVAEVERYAAAGENEETIARALRTQGHAIDQVVVADILAELRKKAG